MKRKVVKYRVGSKENVGMISHGATILNVEIVQEGVDGVALIYFPPILRYTDENGEVQEEKGNGCIAFADLAFSDLDATKEMWRQSKYDFLNLPDKNIFAAKKR